MSAATFPVVRTTAENRAFVESELLPHETLSSFIEDSVMERARWRKEDKTFYARAMEASRRIDAGEKTYTIDEVVASLRAMTQKKKNALAAQAEHSQKAA